MTGRNVRVAVVCKIIVAREPLCRAMAASGVPNENLVSKQIFEYV